MSSFEQIYLRARQPATTTARQLAELLNAELDEAPDGIYLRLPATTTETAVGTTLDVTVGFEVEDHVPLIPDPQPDEVSATDRYDTRLTIWCTPPDPDAQLNEADRLFTRITDGLRQPSLLIHSHDVLVAAWDPTRGRTTFPPGTSPYGPSRSAWEPVID